MGLSDKIEKIKFEQDREKNLEQVIQKIGKVEETDSCITCYVQQDLLEKNAKNILYFLKCDGLNTVHDQSRVDHFKLNKPVYYIFDGITFDSAVNIVSFFSHLIFRNCTFNFRIRILFADHITLENNTYNCCIDFKQNGTAFLDGEVKNLEIKNDQFVNSYTSKYFDTSFGINLEVGRLSINNSTFCADSHGQINIKAKKTIVHNSTISAPEIYLDSDSITFQGGLLKKKDGLIVPTKVLLKAKNGIIIENKNCDFDPWIRLLDIDSPYTIYNGTEVVSIDDEVKNDKLNRARLEVVKVLKNVINKCNQKTLVKSASEREES